MGLVFGRFDQVIEPVKEATRTLAQPDTPQRAELLSAALVIIRAAEMESPHVTLDDLCRELIDLVNEARSLGFLGRNAWGHVAQARFIAVLLKSPSDDSTLQRTVGEFCLMMDVNSNRTSRQAR